MSPVLRTLAIGVMFTSRILVAAPPEAVQKKIAQGDADEVQSPADSRSSDDEKKQLQLATRHVTQIRIEVLGGEGDEISSPIERPLLAYGDPARTASHGTLWAFGASGRPDAFMELWQGTEIAGIWYQSVIRAGDRRLLLRSPDGRKWQPPDEKVGRNRMVSAEPPAGSRTTRLRQLKSLARRFTAYEIGDPDNSRFELRLLVQPVHRYDDTEHALQDGAAFVFAHGTNPEVILLIEALGASLDEARWHYSAFPCSSAELHAALDGREVWWRPGAPNVVGRPTDDYWLFSLPANERLADESGAAEE